MLDGEIDKAIERVMNGNFDEKACVIELNRIIFESNLMKDVLDESNETSI